jgi:hypothetical protein
VSFGLAKSNRGWQGKPQRPTETGLPGNGQFGLVESLEPDFLASAPPGQIAQKAQRSQT